MFFFSKNASQRFIRGKAKARDKNQLSAGSHKLKSPNLAQQLDGSDFNPKMKPSTLSNSNAKHFQSGFSHSPSFTDEEVGESKKWLLQGLSNKPQKTQKKKSYEEATMSSFWGEGYPSKPWSASI